MPKDTADQARWQYAGALFRIMHNLHKPDVKVVMERQLGNIRTEAQGEPDISANLYKGGFEAIAVMYDDAGKVGNPDLEAADRMGAILLDAGFWSLGQTIQRDTLGMREMLVRPSIDRGVPVFRLVYPQTVVASARPQNPSVPVRVEEARERTIDGKSVWTWDITDAEREEFRVVDVEGNDVTALVMPTDDDPGEPMAYPYVKSDGTAFLPYSMYHAQETGSLWNTYDTQGLYEGTLNLALKYTNLAHAELKASWAQRYIVGAQVAGVGVTGSTNPTKRAAVITDPSTALMLEPTDDSIQPQIGQWSSPADLDKMVSAITMYARGLASHLGLNAADVTRTSGDPRSGYALAVNRDSQRTLQRRFAPVFGRADVRTITIVAVLLNRWHEGEGTPGWVSLPEDGWTITYRGIPLSADERRALRDDHAARRAAGTLDIVTAYMEEHPGVTNVEARQALDQIRITNAAYENAAAPTRLEEAAVRQPGLSPDELRAFVIDQELATQLLDSQIAMVLSAAGVSSPPKSTIELAPTDLAAIVSVNEARAQEGLVALPGTTGDISVFAAKAQEQAKADASAAPTPPAAE